MCPFEIHAPRTADGVAVMRSLGACVQSGMAGPHIDVAAAIELSVAFGADRTAAADLIVAAVRGFSDALRSRLDG